MKKITINSIFGFEPQAVVIDAGSFPTNPEALRWLDYTDKIVCCDGAANSYLTHSEKVWRIIGDCDSLSPELRRRYDSIVRQFPDQETNDQTKAVEYLKCHGLTTIAILGATGKREDHTLGNLSLLVDYIKNGINARIYTDYGVFIPSCGDIEIESRPGQQISIFNFGAKELKAAGLRYPIRDFDNWWQGTLNEATEQRVTIHAKGYLLLFVNY